MPSFDAAAKQKMTFGGIIALRITSITFMTIWCAIIVRSNNYFLNKVAVFCLINSGISLILPNSLGSPHPSWCHHFGHISHTGPSVPSLIPSFSCPKQSGEWCWNSAGCVPEAGSRWLFSKRATVTTIVTTFQSCMFFWNKKSAVFGIFLCW